jgi:hypothetical protein
MDDDKQDEQRIGSDRRFNFQPIESSYGLATLYTIGFLGLIFSLLHTEIPSGNRELMLTLVGIMSAAQLAIIKFFYDGSRSADKAQQANIARSVKSEATLQEIAKAVPTIAATVPAAPPSTGAAP